MKDIVELKRDDYIDRCEKTWISIKELDKSYAESRTVLKTDLAKLIEEGKLEADLQVAAVADRVGVKRQTINKILIDTFGVRYPDKAQAAKIGHQARKQK
jgi:AraC-like DNA-binding protein